MEKIILRKTRHTLVMLSISEDPTPGTWGSHMLLKREYRFQDEEYQQTDSFKQMLFNTEFLKAMEEQYGILHCEYCNKSPLVIYHWSHTGGRPNMATADHFISMSEAPHLAKDIRNLRVSCEKCNRKKGSKIWEIKYPYNVLCNSREPVS